MSDLFKTNFGMLYEEDNSTEMITARIDSNSIYQKYYKNNIREYDINLVCDTFELAKKIKLDDEKTWNYIRNSPYVYGQNLAFIEDTINYIYTGRRDVSLFNWMKLVNVSDAKNPMEKDKVTYKKMPNVDNQDILMLWIKRKGGLEDMVIFLYLVLMETEETEI